MKNKTHSILSVFILLVLMLLVGACQNHDVAHSKFEHEALTQKLKNEANEKIVYHLDTLQEIRDLETVEVEMNGEAQGYYIAKRSTALKQAPCANCHGSLEANFSGKPEKSHWDIKLQHADVKVMECATCHDKEDPQNLISITGKGISIDHSYQLCGQCHSSQRKDWEGGAHGKRLAGWLPPRVITTCVSCHNPHEPAFKKRWPARLNTHELTTE